MDELYTFLQAHADGETRLIAYNDCPMVYFALGYLPAYGMSWARNDTMSLATQKWLAQDMLSRPLPKFALRATVDLTGTNWRTSRREDYQGYPLNQVVEERYRELPNIYPFEVFELRSREESRGRP
jgi:hypothetical protein